jgi:hypothetical protein
MSVLSFSSVAPLSYINSYPSFREEGLTLGVGEVDDVAILLEHVDLLNSLDGLDVHLLESGLELLVVGGGGLVDALGLAAGGTLSSVMLLVFVVCTSQIDVFCQTNRATDRDRNCISETMSLHTLHKKTS